VAPGAVAAGTRRLLSCLDLDMAFDARSFVDVETGAVGRPAAEFERLLLFERLNLLEVLSGADATSGVPQKMLGAVRGDPALQVAASALYDTLVLNFMRASGLLGGGGASGGSGATPEWSQPLHDAAHALMRLAIIVMADYAA
jgi:hypothetical protein